MDLFSTFSNLSVGADRHRYLQICTGSQHFLVHIRLHPVITIHIADIIALCDLNTGIPGSRGTSIFLVDHRNTGTLCCISVTDLSRPVCRSVIHYNNFQSLVGLCDQTVQTSWQISFYIVSRHNNGYQKLGLIHLFILQISLCINTDHIFRINILAILIIEPPRRCEHHFFRESIQIGSPPAEAGIGHDLMPASAHQK